MKLDLSNNSINENSMEPIVTQLVKSQGLGIDTVVILLAVGGIIFGFFYLLKKYIFPLWNPGKGLNKVKRLTFRIEVVVWLLFTLIGLTQLFSDNLWLTSAIVIVTLWVGLNFWRDFFPGLLVRASNTFSKNDPVRFEEFSGVIASLGRTSLHLKTEEEELVYIPYHKLSKGIFIKRQAKGKLMSTKIVLPIGEKDPDAVIRFVNDWIHQCPWAIAQQKNTASIQPGGQLNVTVYAVDKTSLGKVERFVKSKMDTFEER